MKTKKLSAFILLTAVSFGTNVFASAENKDDSSAKAIIAAPPAPGFSDVERQAELARRRAEVFKRLPDNSALILKSAEPRNYAGDVDFMYRQENNLYYLTSLKQKDIWLILMKESGKETTALLVPDRDPSAETWNGKMYSREDAARITGIKNIFSSRIAPDFLKTIKDKKLIGTKDSQTSSAVKKLYFLLPYGEGDNEGKAEFSPEAEIAKDFQGFEIVNARSIFDDLRLVKSPYELKILQHAIDITTEAHMRAMATAKQVKYEYETQAEIEYTFRRRNADYWGYPSIVGCGPNATTLHYIESQGAVKPGDLLLMDVGAEYDHYTADVTRTFPTSGKFTKEQAEIYQIVYDAQEAAAKTIKPGAKFSQPQSIAAKTIADGLAKLGLITAPNATYEMSFNGATAKMPQYTLWFMHGWGHWLGMNVHDVGDYQSTFKPGMVMTNEPGVYIREDALNYLPDTPANREMLAKIKPAFEKYKNIGVRIEDDMLVTETGVEWMTKKLPRSIADVEAFIAKAEKEVSIAKFERELFPEILLINTAGILENEDKFGFIFPRGKTVRQGWIYKGKQTAMSGLAHAGHSHSE